MRVLEGHVAGDRQSSLSSQRDPARRCPAWLMAVVQTAFWQESSTPQSLSVLHVPPVGITQTLLGELACALSQTVPAQQALLPVQVVPRHAGRVVQT
jgi:hypothetical protein